MPYEVIQKKYEFVVLYSAPAPGENCEIFWTRDKAEAEAECERQNAREKTVHDIMQPAFQELIKQLNEPSEKILLRVQTWIAAQQDFLQEAGAKDAVNDTAATIYEVRVRPQPESSETNRPDDSAERFAALGDSGVRRDILPVVDGRFAHSERCSHLERDNVFVDGHANTHPHGSRRSQMS